MARNLPTPFRFIEDPGWAPFGLLQREVSRLFDDVAHNGEGQSGRGGLIAPQLDVRETDKEYRVTVELPGVAEQDVEVDLEGDLLTIRAEKKVDRDIERADQHITERVFGVFKRSIRLPQPVDAQSVTATLQNGVLQISIPKAERASSRQRVPVTNQKAAPASESSQGASQAA